MNTINNILPAHNQYATISDHNQTRKNSNLDLQNNFLEIFLSQMQNQDPINPMTNNELTSQLTEMNTANGIEQINANLIALKQQIHRNQSFQISSLIGHGVLFPSSKVYYNSSRNSTFGIDLSEDATSVDTEISDQNGKILFFKNMGPLPAGMHDFSWDGITNDGLQVKNGTYNFSINAKKGDKSINFSPLTYAKVQGVITSLKDDAVIDLEHFKEIAIQHVRKIF